MERDRHGLGLLFIRQLKRPEHLACGVGTALFGMTETEFLAANKQISFVAPMISGYTHNSVCRTRIVVIGVDQFSIVKNSEKVGRLAFQVRTPL
jgi:hypothetical protein